MEAQGNPTDFADGRTRCKWVNLTKPLYLKYHDEEWGVPVFDDQKMFEFLVLEAFQAGLSWEIILNKRENFRRAFDDFHAEKVAAYSEKKVQELLENKDIIRNHLKIKATVNNARRFRDTAEQFGSFTNYLWSFIDGKPIINHWKSVKEIPASTSLSDRVSLELKERGFKFIGTTVCYAHLQAVGMVNDHTIDCFRHGECQALLPQNRTFV